MKKFLAILLVLISYVSYSQCAIDTIFYPVGSYSGCFPSQFPTQTVTCGMNSWEVSQIIQFEATSLPVTIQMTPLSFPSPVLGGLLLDDCGNVIWDSMGECFSVLPFNTAGLPTNSFYTLDFQLPPGTYYWATYIPSPTPTGCYYVLIGTFGVLGLDIEEYTNVPFYKPKYNFREWDILGRKIK